MKRQAMNLLKNVTAMKRLTTIFLKSNGDEAFNADLKNVAMKDEALNAS